MLKAPNLASVRELAELVPGTTPNFWYQRSRFGKIPGQHKCGRFVVIDLDVFFQALKEDQICTLTQESK